MLETILTVIITMIVVSICGFAYGYLFTKHRRRK